MEDLIGVSESKWLEKSDGPTRAVHTPRHTGAKYTSRDDVKAAQARQSHTMISDVGDGEQRGAVGVSAGGDCTCVFKRRCLQLRNVVAPHVGCLLAAHTPTSTITGADAHSPHTYRVSNEERAVESSKTARRDEAVCTVPRERAEHQPGDMGVIEVSNSHTPLAVLTDSEQALADDRKPHWLQWHGRLQTHRLHHLCGVKVVHVTQQPECLVACIGNVAQLLLTRLEDEYREGCRVAQLDLLSLTVGGRARLAPLARRNLELHWHVSRVHQNHMVLDLGHEHLAARVDRQRRRPAHQVMLRSAARPGDVLLGHLLHLNLERIGEYHLHRKLAALIMALIAMFVLVDESVAVRHLRRVKISEIGTS
eukprot:2912309-Prymnesium_polylepis.3